MNLVNPELLLIVVAVGGFGIAAYFSPVTLRRIAVRALARAETLERSRVIHKNMLAECERLFGKAEGAGKAAGA